MTHLAQMMIRGWLALVLVVAGFGCATVAPKGEEKLSAREASQLRYQMAERLVEQRDYEHALPYIRGLLVQYPKNLRLRLMLVDVLREKGMLENARRELERVAKRYPDRAEVEASYGVVLDYLGKHREAERRHRRAVKLAPKNPRYANNLGFCLFLQRRLGEAKEMLLEAIGLDPGFRMAFNNLGFIYGLEGDRKAAMDAFNQAGSEALAFTNLGLVDEMRGQPLMAKRHYERALRAQPGYPPALRNLRALDGQVVQRNDRPSKEE
jgi:Tfp pilus assembly protein PilF